MEYFIQIKDGQPFEHPIDKENFLQAFPTVDIDNLPADFARFERVAMPKLNPYDEYTGLTYEWDNGVVKDVHHISEVSAEIKAEKIASVIAAWEASPYKALYPSWTFCEPCCCFEPPTPMPKDGSRYVWDEASLSWLSIDNSTQATEIVNETFVFGINPASLAPAGADSVSTIIVDEVVSVEVAPTITDDQVVNVVNTESVSPVASDIIIDLSSNGADSLPGGV